MHVRSIGIAVGAAAMLSSWGAALAQPSRGFVESLPLPPAEGYQVDRVFDMHRWETGENWLETTIANYGVSGGASADANNFAYARVTLQGRPGQIYVNSYWDYQGTPIDQPRLRPDGVWGDDCGHSHHLGAVYWRVESPTISGYFLIGSHSGLGMRLDSNDVERQYGQPGVGHRCAVTSRPSTIYPSFNEAFRWGGDGYYMDVDPAFTREVILAAQSPTHGTGQCPAFECYVPVAILMAQIL
jgi:hypothetical protein